MHFKVKGAILSSKVRWYEEGECNARYFFGLENRAQTKKAINKLKINDDTYIYDQLAILDKQKKFYESIYQSKESDEDIPQGSNFLKAELVTPLSPEDQKLCDGPITDAECLSAVKDFKKMQNTRNRRFPS